MTPDSHTIQETFVNVGDDHTLYVHEWGNKKAKSTIIYLHGGPGGSCSDRLKREFDPAQQHIVFFDQRGCGRSVPFGSLEHNTTDDMIEDINKITEQLGIKTFILYGGSWGSCLALAYAIHYPKRATALVLWGVFTSAQAEIDYLEGDTFRILLPDVWQRYLEATPKAHHGNPTKYHYAQMAGDNEQAKRVSACAYQNFEGAICRLDERFIPQNPDDPTYDPSGICIEANYMTNRCFMPDRFILENAKKLTMPVWLVQGRYDLVCPPQTAYALHQVLPNSQLIWTISGHAPERSTSDVVRALLLQLGS